MVEVVTEAVCKELERRSMTHADLADLMGVRRQEVTRLLTVGISKLVTLERIASALRMRLVCRLEERT